MTAELAEKRVRPSALRVEVHCMPQRDGTHDTQLIEAGRQLTLRMGFLMPSVYCADLDKIIRHIATRIAPVRTLHGEFANRDLTQSRL